MEDNVKCLIEVGDSVQVQEDWGPKLGGKKGKVIRVRRHINCESGFMVSTDFYSRELDANWLIKLPA